MKTVSVTSPEIAVEVGDAEDDGETRTHALPFETFQQLEWL